MTESFEKRGLYAGSFDPPTNGHLYIIEQGARVFKHLHVAVAHNPEKKSLFSAQERVDMLRCIASHLDNVSISEFSEKFTANYAKELGCYALLRGLRSEKDFQDEFPISAINRTIQPDLLTILVPGPPELLTVSSSVVKSFVGPENWEEVVGRYVSPPVLEMIIVKHIEGAL